jgi:hypothetical protein
MRFKGADGFQSHTEREQSTTNEPFFDYLSSNHQASLCWSCFLPIFGNRPDMFDGDLVHCTGDDNEEPICHNTRCHFADATGLPCYGRSSSDNEISTSFEHRRSGSPLVTIPSPVLVTTNEQHHHVSIPDHWSCQEVPGLMSTDLTPNRGSSSGGSCRLNYATTLNDVDNMGKPGENTKDRVSGRPAEIRGMLKQGDIQMSFAAPIASPQVEGSNADDIKAYAFSTEEKITIAGQIQIGDQILNFNTTSALQ